MSSSLRNRFTHKSYQPSGKLVSQTMFGKKETPFQKMLQEFLRDLEARFPKPLTKEDKDKIKAKAFAECENKELSTQDKIKILENALAVCDQKIPSREERLQILEEIRSECEKNEKFLEQICKESPTQEEFFERATQFFKDQTEQKSKPVEKLSTTGDFVKGVITDSIVLATSSYLPAVGVLLTLATPAAAQTVTTLVTHGGTPPGGSDLCSGYITGCLSGYLTNGTQPWGITMPQFQRYVKQVATKDASTTYYMQLRDCMTNSKMGQIVGDSYLTGHSMDLATCALSSSDWNGWTVTGQSTHLPVDSCIPLKNAFEVAVNGCQSWKGAAAKWGIGLGVGLGIACLCFCAWAACKTECCTKLDKTKVNTDEEKVEAPKVGLPGPGAV